MINYATLTRDEAIKRIDDHLDMSEYEDGSYGGRFVELEYDFAEALAVAHDWDDDSVWIKRGVEIRFPRALIEAAKPRLTF